MSQTPRRVPASYLTLFTLLYAIQGVVFAYFINFNPKYMMAAGIGEETVGGIQSLALMPFVFKFLAGPFSDRFNLLGLGHRKPYIVLGLILQAVGLIALSWIDPGRNLPAFTALAILTVTGLALYDTCTDGMIVDITPDDDRPRVQGLLMFSRFFTATIFALGFGYWLDRTGTGPGQGYRVLWTCAGLTGVPLVLALILPEPSKAGAEEFDWRALKVLVRPRALALLAFGTFYAVIAYGVEINLPVYFDHLGFGQGHVGLFGASRNLGRAVGALLMPLGASWLGRRWILRIAVLSLVLSEAAQAAVGGTVTAGIFGFAFGAANGWTEALFYVMAMEASDPRMAASTYALFMAVSNLSVTGGFFFSVGVWVLDGRFRPAFVLAALVTLGALPMIRPLSRPAPKPESSDAVVA